MDCDDEELKATKNREKTADELFKKIGYELKINSEYSKIYKTKRFLNEEYTIIHFDLEEKTVHVCENTNKDEQDSCFAVYRDRHKITMQELQAINKKVEELGWK